MSAIAATDRLFFERADATLDQDAAARLTGQALAGSDDGELFLEYRESESISLDDGRIRSAELRHHAGLRPARGGRRGDRLRPCRRNLARPRCAAPPPPSRAVAAGHSGTAAEPPRATNARLYSDANPLAGMDFAARTALLGEIDAYARGRIRASSR